MVDDFCNKEKEEIDVVDESVNVSILVLVDDFCNGRIGSQRVMGERCIVSILVLVDDFCNITFLGNRCRSTCMVSFNPCFGRRLLQL